MTKKIPNLEIVFVQLGPYNYKHLLLNIELVNRIFPHILINCIISKESNYIKTIPSYVNVFIYEPSSKVNELMESKSIDKKFRNGFWRYSLERLIAIESFYSKNRDRVLLHVESDILLLPQFPFNEFLKLKQIYWLPVNPESDIASLVFFPSYELTKEFRKDLLSYISKAKIPTDMKALSHLRQKFPEKYRLLPVSHSSLPKLGTLKTQTSTDSQVDFDGIFDASKIGMWLTGIDPRNSYGLSELFATEKLTLDNSFVDPSAYPIRFTENEGLYFEVGKQKIIIYNLHIHSKSKKIFSRNWNEEISYLTFLSHKNKLRNKFYPGTLILLVVENFSKGTFLEFLYNSPIFYIVRRLKIILKSSR